jgi:hypothetical protein
MRYQHNEKITIDNKFKKTVNNFFPLPPHSIAQKFSKWVVVKVYNGISWL